jgi:hypothetical protein
LFVGQDVGSLRFSIRSRFEWQDVSRFKFARHQQPTPSDPLQLHKCHTVVLLIQLRIAKVYGARLGLLLVAFGAQTWANVCGKLTKQVLNGKLADMQKLFSDSCFSWQPLHAGSCAGKQQSVHHGCGHRMLQSSLVSNALILSSWFVCEHVVVPYIGLVRDACQMSLSISADNAAVAVKHIRYRRKKSSKNRKSSDWQNRQNLASATIARQHVGPLHTQEYTCKE